MTLSTPLLIHEFSTGIQAERTTDGGWRSRGFTGEYMNKTIDPIPTAIQDAISNQEFAVAEGASRDDPATIGREIIDGEDGWSVVAVVTRGRDDRGRDPSLYRYFLCEGLGNLPKILAWLNSQRQAGKNSLFDPFDHQVVGQPHQYRDTELVSIPIRTELKGYLTQSPPVVIAWDIPCAPLILDTMARQMTAGQPVAWAYRVDALEQPRSFHLIQPGSSKAETLIKNALANAPRNYMAVSGEQAIKSAISGLISRDRVKVEQLQTIENALTNPQIDDNYWQALFEGKGTKQAISQGIYSPQMVRLLNLQAIVVPETLPDFLAWLSRRDKQTDHCGISEQFQGAIKKYLNQVPNLADCIRLGVILIIPKLIDHSDLLPSTIWLLNSHQGLWSYLYEYQVKKDIDHDLGLMANYERKKKANLSFQLREFQDWNNILNDLRGYWAIPHYPKQQKYLPFAQLFEALEDYQLATFFYHVVVEQVPKQVFFQISPRHYSCLVYGVRVKRELDLHEHLALFLIRLGETIVPLPIVAILVFLSLSIGFVSVDVLGLSFFKLKDQNNKVYEQEDQLGKLSKKNSELQNITSKMIIENNSLDVDKAKKGYSTTESAMKKIIDELKKIQSSQDIPADAVEQVLLSPDSLIPYKLTQKEKKQELIIRAIYTYQKKNPLLTDDGIISIPKGKEQNKNTYNALKCDVAKENKISTDSIPDCNSEDSSQAIDNSTEAIRGGM